jgi:hypothetical protein
MHDLDYSCIWILARVRAVQPVHIRQEEKVIRRDHGGCNRRQGIVVSEFDFLANNVRSTYVETEKWPETHAN